MLSIELNNQEIDMLEGILMSYLSDLRMEVAATDRKAFRDGLKAREFFIKNLLDRLSKAEVG